MPVFGDTPAHEFEHTLANIGDWRRLAEGKLYLFAGARPLRSFFVIVRHPPIKLTVGKTDHQRINQMMAMIDPLFDPSVGSLHALFVMSFPIPPIAVEFLFGDLFPVVIEYGATFAKASLRNHRVKLPDAAQMRREPAA